MHIQLLGGFAISYGKATIPADQWRSKRARNLVKLLALAPGYRLHRDQIMDTLWPDSDTAAAVNNFHQTLYGARKVLDTVLRDCLVMDDGFLSIATSPAQQLTIDAEQFVHAAIHAQDQNDPAVIEAALALYTGDVLPEDLYEDWITARRDGLRHAYLLLLQRLATVHETHRDYAGGIAALQKLLTTDKSNEGAHAGLMRLYALAGQTQQAQRQYQALREALRTELDAEPSPATTQLYTAIQSGRFAPAQGQSTAPASSSTPSIRATSNQPEYKLPVQFTSFIGRETEIDAVCHFLAKNRLVTLTGSGGAGKSRLALEVAGRLRELFRSGCCLVELAPVSDPHAVAQTVAASLGLQRTQDITYEALLVNYLRDQELLLILDNCEHLLMVCAELAGTLLGTCPQLVLLATSREALGITGEVSYRVPSLNAPDTADLTIEQIARIEAVQLFSERAVAVLPTFQLTEQNLKSTAHICHRLDGIPLAIELAAARVGVLSVEQIAARLDDRFRLLNGGSRTALPRQRTLRASIDWSYSLLSESERLLLQRLSVFSGGWTLEAAEQVCAFAGLESWEILDGLASLVNKSLVVMNLTAGDAARYHMLETIRQFTQEKLADGGLGAVMRDRQLDFMLKYAEECGPLLHTSRIVDVLDRLDLEKDNLRGAMAWALGRHDEAGAEVVVRIIYALQYFWITRALATEVLTWIDGTVAHLTASDASRVELRAKALYVHGSLTVMHLLDLVKARGYLHESIRLFNSIGNAQGEALSLCYLGWALYSRLSPGMQEKYQGAPVVQEEEAQNAAISCIALAKTLLVTPGTENQWTYATIVERLSGIDQLDIHIFPATAIHQSRAIFAELGDLLGELNAFTELAWRAQTPQECESILPQIKQEIQIAERLKSKYSLSWLTNLAGNKLYALGQYREMTDYYMASRRFFQETGNLWAVMYLVRLAGMGLYLHDDLNESRTWLLENMAMCFEAKAIYGVYSCMIFLAGIWSKRGVFQRTLKLLGFIERQLEVNKMIMDDTDFAEYDRLVSRVKLEINADEYATFWQQGRAMSLDEALIEAKTELT